MKYKIMSRVIGDFELEEHKLKYGDYYETSELTTAITDARASRYIVIEFINEKINKKEMKKQESKEKNEEEKNVEEKTENGNKEIFEENKKEKKSKKKQNY